ncbi:PDR/VanB family oxidoreductase [Marisediminicola senii]|uniref:PDR/VanB family oxidoreductase n=1 Tax=Marisediminicola senii TaxID=2711233 RepID=UPI0013ED9016|nr:PDR/VanB family oxidoreductase [Marisediminicola senii]
MSFFSDVERDCIVERRTEVAEGIVALDVVAVNGRDLPPWTPGSHVDLLLPGDDDVIVRQYSLCGDPGDRQRYRVAVLRELEGRGGSAIVHDTVTEGQPVRIRGPRNHFGYEPVPGQAVVFIAGGIGITPFLSMARAADAAGIDYTVVYAGRRRATMAFLGDLVEAHGDRVMVYAADEGNRLDAAALLGGLKPGTAVYCCGPNRLVAAVEEATADWPAGLVHVEHFEAKEFGPPVWQETFEVELALSGITVEVPIDRSILDVVEENGVLVVSSCRIGTCGTCETPVLEGEIEHRDSVLTAEEQSYDDTMMICVSRAACPRLVLDL